MMKYIKNNTNLDYIGFSATPIRCNYENQQRTQEIFGDPKNDEYNIIYEYSYYSALKNRDICPIKYCPINITLGDLIEKKIQNDDEKECRSNRVLSSKSYIKIWKQIEENIIKKNNLFFKKGIFWFRSRVEMMDFYNSMNKVITNYELIPTMSIGENDTDEIKKLIQKSKLTENDFNNGITRFLEKENNAILLSVMRATEGFDDDRLEFGIRMYHSENIDHLNESQKMGRFNRWHKNNPNGEKKNGYYGTLELIDNKDEIRKSLIKRFKSWIAFAKRYDKGTKNKTKETIKKELKELINLYVDIKTLEYYEIDVEKDIIKSYEEKEFDKYKIKRALKIENKSREKNDKIKTKSEYDKWALDNDFPICDELEEKGFDDFKWLFDMKDDDYLSWKELKRVCKEYQINNPNINQYKIYDLIIDEDKFNLPQKSMLKHVYKEYNSIKDLFM